MKNLIDIATSCRNDLILKLGLYPEDTLYGFCAIASADLFVHLIDSGYMPVLHVSEMKDEFHVFVSVENHILDITASQFGDAPVVVIDKEKALVRDYWCIDYTFNDLNELHQYLKNVEWNEDYLFEV